MTDSAADYFSAWESSDRARECAADEYRTAYLFRMGELAYDELYYGSGKVREFIRAESSNGETFSEDIVMAALAWDAQPKNDVVQDNFWRAIGRLQHAYTLARLEDEE